MAGCGGEVLHDEEVARIARISDDLQFEIEPFFDIVGNAAVAFAGALESEVAQVLVLRAEPGGQRKRRQEHVAGQLEMIHLVENFHGGINGVRHIVEETVHLILRFKIKIGAGKPEAVFLLDEAVGVHTEQHIVRAPVFFFEVVGVVGANDFDVVLGSQLQQVLVHIFLADAQSVNVFHIAVALDFDVEILPHEVNPPAQQRLCFIQFSMQNGLWNFGADATTGGDESLVVLHQQLLVNAGVLAVKPLDETERTELREVLVARAVLGQQQLVVPHVFFVFAAQKLLFVAVFDEIKLAAHDGFEAAFVGFGHKFESAEHVAVVGEGYAALAIVFGLVHHGGDVGGAV